MFSPVRRPRHMGATLIRRGKRRRKFPKGMSVVTESQLKAMELPLQDATQFLRSQLAGFIQSCEGVL